MQTKNSLTGRSLVKSVDIVALIESYGVRLEKSKGEYVGLCPFHADANPSFYVNPKKGVFCCAPCGFGGSALDFVIHAEQARGHSYPTPKEEQAAAFKILEAGTAGGALPQTEYNPNREKDSHTVLSPVPPEAGPAAFHHYQLGIPVKTWAYRNAAGELLGYVARFDKADGGKDVLPLSYIERNGKRFWAWKGQPYPRPLYGLEKLASAPTAPVLLVEGEKAADAANSVAGGAYVALSWAGGARGIRFADWAALKGRNVVCWPDADTPGFEAMFGYWSGKAAPEWKPGIAELAAQGGAAAVQALTYAEGSKPEGWDVADAVAEGWQGSDVVAFIRANIGPPPAVAAPAIPAPQLQPPPLQHTLTPEPPAEADPETGEPFKCLGYGKNGRGQNEFHFYAYKARQVLTFTPASFTKTSLLQLASITYWQENYGGPKGKDPYENEAAEALIDACYAAGVYNPETVRGIGAWIDEERVVVHAGTHLVSGGKEYDLQNFQSEFLYEANRPFGFNVVKPLENKEAAKFLEAINLLTWERPAFAHLFLGWCIIAPVCGALSWRSHIWLTGPAGSGKTTAMSLLHKLVGNIALRVQGNTTEAAIRQLLDRDARPVCFDEADADNFNDNTRLQTILSLVRTASSQDGGGIAKGGANGNAKTFLIRSCFAFASITPKTANAADRSRVSVLSLVKPPEFVKTETEKRWQKIEQQLHECFTPDRCERMQARTLSLLPQILENAKVFSRAAALVLGEQRAGDQLGVLLAGAYSTTRTDIVSFEDAKKWIEARNWDEIRNEEKDEQLLLSKIMEQQVRVRSAGGVEHERTVGELVMIAAEGAHGSESVGREEAQARLGRIGIRAEADALYISNTADFITKVLKGTAWATNHGRVLARLEGAEATKNTYFGPGTKSRAVKIPINILKG